MANDVFERLKDFVSEQAFIDKGDLSRESRIQEDLGITGDDSDEFLLAYGEKFKVDLSEFDIAKYFKPEGDTILPALIRFFTGKKPPEYLPLTLGDLENGIKRGKLT